MEELLGRVKQGFWTFTGLNFKWKQEHKQWEHHFARGFSSWCEIWPFRTMKKPPWEISQGGFRHLVKCQISQGGFSPCEIGTFHFPPLRNALEIPCFETLLMIFHCRFSKIFCLTFNFVIPILPL